jgi:hypothetical protein
MKKINAFWEKRNLGVDCVELEANTNDSLSEFSDTVMDLMSEYQVLRIPSGRTDMLLFAQKLGFHVIEMSIELARKTKDYCLPNIYKRFEPYINIVEADENSINKVLLEIKDGNMFVTDRIAMDPFFPVDKSGNRYYYWSRDILNAGAHLFLAQYKNENVGFGLNNSKGGTLYDAVLGGVFPKYANKGLGFLSIHANAKSIISQGGTNIVTRVSSNNAPILRLHMLFGFDIHDMDYVLIRHLEV